MIASIKRPREWSVGDWSAMLCLIGTLVAGAWWMSAQNSLLSATKDEVRALRIIVEQAVREQKKEDSEQWAAIRDNERNIFLLQNRS